MGRYLAILAIIALGVGFFSGLKVTKPGMVETGNKYLREHNFYDFRLLSSIGFDADAVEEMRKQEHVLAADGSYYEDMIYEDADGKEKVLRAQSITEHVNTLELRDGRMPEADDECVVDAYQFKVKGELTNQAGKVQSFSEKEFKNLAPATCYTLKFDASNVGGSSITISFDDTVVDADLIDVDLND